jgi:hypothetical protein
VRGKQPDLTNGLAHDVEAGRVEEILVDRYGNFAAENLLSAASRIERSGEGRNVAELSRFRHAEMK